MKPSLYLINGPLGAGKTTFLKQLLMQPDFKKARVIENEFASTSIDTQTLHKHTAEVRTIAGVCICCGSGEELVEVLESLKNDSEPVVIEATGVANSLKLIEKMAASDILASYSLAHGIFVLDAAESTKDTLDAYANELRGTDTVLISKSDLVTDEQFAQLKEQLAALGVTSMQKVNNGVCDFTLLEQPSGMLAYFANFDGDIAPHDDQVNYTVIQLGNWKIDATRLQQAWPALQKAFSLQRMKGDVIGADSSTWHVEATPSQCRVNQSVKAAPQLVLIGGNAREVTLETLKKACG